MVEIEITLEKYSNLTGGFDQWIVKNEELKYIKDRFGKNPVFRFFYDQRITYADSDYKIKKIKSNFDKKDKKLELIIASTPNRSTIFNELGIHFQPNKKIYQGIMSSSTFYNNLLILYCNNLVDTKRGKSKLSDLGYLIRISMVFFGGISREIVDNADF